MKALTASFVVALLGCGPAAQHGTRSDVPPGTYLITAEQIEKSGAHTAWQVLKQHAPMLQTRDDRNGRPASLGRRGRASLYLDDSPAILVDGVRIPIFGRSKTSTPSRSSRSTSTTGSRGPRIAGRIR